jgi:hypothetical protein
MRRFAILVVAVFLAAPALASHRGPLSYTSEAREELADSEAIVRGIRDPSARAELLARLDHVDMLLAQAEDELSTPPSPPMLGFADARTMVTRESFDDDRLEVIRRLGRTGSFSTDEARQLVELCTFDSTRKDALIAIYPAVTDPQRFMLALDALTFSSSRREVETALGL